MSEETPNHNFKCLDGIMTERDTLGNEIFGHPSPRTYWPPAVLDCTAPPKENTFWRKDTNLHQFRPPCH